MHTTLRADSANLQFQRRTPAALKHLLRQKLSLQLRSSVGGAWPITISIGTLIKFSLGTRDPVEADWRRADINAQIEKLMRGAEPPRRITQKDAFAIAHEAYQDRLAIFDADPGTDVQQWRSMVAFLGLDIGSADERTIAFRDTWIDCEISNTLERLGYEVDFESHAKLQHAFRQVLPRAYGVLAQRVEGDYSPEPHGSRLPKLEHGQLADEKVGENTISAAFDGYSRESERRGLGQTTRNKYGSVVAKFIDIGVAIAPVYTPPKLRCKGYAGAVTAAIVEEILERDYRYAYLFTDDSNPASNRCYAKIGFQPYCKANMYRR